ncbi:hypothetical protein GCM10010210_45460 [Pseudonocardia hydrocarbonoxydans]|uniref:STAS domain-containing protein n=1 Tax=Pseudonocardia hydrocarbonoxydans TaxID=76726 RepID=A0A4Y3WUT0_9PSEU|nr:hypothetical protein PHY01_48660 [Pseudonocardia hydrocarbonoxydans]
MTDPVVPVTSDGRVHLDGDVCLTVRPSLRVPTPCCTTPRRGTGTVVVDLSRAGVVSCRAAELLLHHHRALRPSGRRSLAICGLAPVLDTVRRPPDERLTMSSALWLGPGPLGYNCYSGRRTGDDDPGTG